MGQGWFSEKVLLVFVEFVHRNPPRLDRAGDKLIGILITALSLEMIGGLT